MTIAETKKQILTSDAFVLEECKRMQFFYGLKHEIRYKNERTIVKDPYDSVAEHVYGMHILFQYFCQLENESGDWDKAKMLSMITLHDIEEVITGDVIGYDKTQTDKEAEIEALQMVYDQIPTIMLENTKTLLEEYEERKTPEARFVKAIDKIEPIIHLYNPEGKEMLHHMGTTYEQNESIKVQYFTDFPIIMRFYKVCAEKMREEGFFVEGT